MIRQATNKDLPAIAKVHRLCFPDSYVTQLSKFSRMDENNLLCKFYYEYLNDNPELFVVAESDEGKVVGFCMGYYMDKDDQMSLFLNKNRVRVVLKTFLLMISGNKQVWKKLLMRFKHKPVQEDWTIINDKYEHIGNDERGDLLSICVLPDYRGHGYAVGLMNSYLESMAKHEKKICLLSVRADNSRACKFYEKCGFELYRTKTSGGEGYTYIRELSSFRNATDKTMA